MNIRIMLLFFLFSFVFNIPCFAYNDRFRGDVNSDGTVDIADVIQTVNYINQPSLFAFFNYEEADVNNDGNVDANDIVIMTGFIMGNYDIVFYPIEICAHRYGKKMTYTDQTDGLHTNFSYLPYMSLAKARNIKVGCFMAYGEPALDDGTVKADYEAGNIWLDIYSYAPNIQTKIINKEQISQAEWNEAYNDYLLPDFKGFTGKKPVVLSYSYGTDTFKDYITQLLGARNSSYNGNTDYGVGYGNPNDQPYGFSRFKSKIGTTRWYDYAKTHGNLQSECCHNKRLGISLQKT